MYIYSMSLYKSTYVMYYELSPINTYRINSLIRKINSKI